jgi:hypothetical protein
MRNVSSTVGHKWVSMTLCKFLRWERERAHEFTVKLKILKGMERARKHTWIVQ